jgi:hypothetical protein
VHCTATTPPLDVTFAALPMRTPLALASSAA